MSQRHTRESTNTMRNVHTDNAPGAIGPYSQAVVAGKMVFCSGQIPLDPKSGNMVAGTIAEQTNRVLLNLTAVLKEAGGGLSKVVKTTVFLADMNDFQEMNKEYARHFGDHKPARAAVQAAALPKGARVEIEAIAVLD